MPKPYDDFFDERAAQEKVNNLIDAAIAEHKETNPKDALGIAKAPLSTVPLGVVALLGLGMMEGGRKYGRHNYREAGVRASVYFDAAWRHLAAWYEGEDIDEKSGLPHLAKAMASIAVVLDGIMTGTWVDDRPPALLPADWMEDMNARAAALIEKIPNPKPPFTQKHPPLQVADTELHMPPAWGDAPVDCA